MNTDRVLSVTRSSFASIVSSSPAARLARAAAMNRAADALALAGLRRRHPTASAHIIGVALALQRVGRVHDHALATRLTEETTVSDTPMDFLEVAARAAAICTDLTIPYLIGGGVASTVHGEFRTTRDVDLIVRLKRVHAAQFAAALARHFTLNPPDIVDALARVPALAADRTQRATFAAYDRATGYQLDVFCASDSPFDRAQFERAITLDVPEVGGTLIIASAEDTILTKLEWYAITPSDRQWDDVQAILRVQGEALDMRYLDTWATQLGVASLLAAARRAERAPHLSLPSASQNNGPHQTRMDM